MATQISPHQALAGQTVPDAYRNRVFHDMPALANLLDQLDAGSTPNFLDVMAGISEMVAFYTNPDLLESVEYKRFCEMSGKYCRFCS